MRHASAQSRSSLSNRKFPWNINWPILVAAVTLSAMKPYLTVSQTDEAVPDQAPPNGEGRVREPPSWKRLGTYNIFILAFGTSAVFLAVGFLAFVWAGAGQAIRGGSPPPLWYTIVANKWTTRVVSIYENDFSWKLGGSQLP